MELRKRTDALGRYARSPNVYAPSSSLCLSVLASAKPTIIVAEFLTLAGGFTVIWLWAIALGA